MSSKSAPPPSPLVAAAIAFDTALETFSRLSDLLAKTEIDGEKALERAAGILTEIANTEESLGALAQRLMSALTAARDRQQAQAAEVTERAKGVETASRTFQELLERFAKLGQEAAALNRLGGEMSAKAPSDREGATRELLPQLDDLHTRMSDLAENSRVVSEDAHAARFGDIGRKAHELRQQLLSARNKVHLLQQKLTS